jgi:hypothetical protein
LPATAAEAWLNSSAFFWAHSSPSVSVRCRRPNSQLTVRCDQPNRRRSHSGLDFVGFQIMLNEQENQTWDQQNNQGGIISGQLQQ